MSDDEILQAAADGGFRDVAQEALSQELTIRGIGTGQLRNERKRQKRARLQVKVGSNPYDNFRGTGLCFRGKKFKTASDEQHAVLLQTRWLVLSWMPLLPLGSYRVRNLPESERGYEIVSEERLQWDQVLAGWAKASVILLAIILGWKLLSWLIWS
jgi:hypothetical protein